MRRAGCGTAPSDMWLLTHSNSLSNSSSGSSDGLSSCFLFIVAPFLIRSLYSCQREEVLEDWGMDDPDTEDLDDAEIQAGFDGDYYTILELLDKIDEDDFVY